MTLDYTQAVRKRSQLDAALDAAVIAAVTPSMLSQSNAAATTAATNVFNATAVGLPGLSGQPALNITVTNVGLVRTVTASYTSASTNNFPILLGTPAWNINGTSAASASGAPNINFYLLLDDSPSMAIAGTPAGVATMVIIRRPRAVAPSPVMKQTRRRIIWEIPEARIITRWRAISGSPCVSTCWPRPPPT